MKDRKGCLMKVLRILTVLFLVTLLYVFRVALLALGCVIYVYLLPGVIASHRNYAKADRIYWACGLTGWLIAPWFASLFYVLLHTKPNSPDHLLIHWS